MGNNLDILRAGVKKQGKSAVIAGIFRGIRKEVRKRATKDRPVDRDTFAQSMFKELHDGKDFTDLLSELAISDKDLMFHINDGIDDGLKELSKKELPKVGINDMGLSNIRHYISRRRALYYGLLGGVAGVLLDADHILPYYFKGLPPRPFHWPAFWLAGCFVVYYGACLGRLLCKMVLKRGKVDGSRD